MTFLQIATMDLKLMLDVVRENVRSMAVKRKIEKGAVMQVNHIRHPKIKK